MQQRDQEQSEDYGYDLVHEITAGDPSRRKDAAHYDRGGRGPAPVAVSYTHLRAHRDRS